MNKTLPQDGAIALHVVRGLAQAFLDMKTYSGISHFNFSVKSG